MHTGIRIADVGGALFSGNISNSGAIKTATAAGGIVVSSVVAASGRTFAGNIINGGAISAANGLGLLVTKVANNGGTFDGNIVNSGAISATQFGLEIQNVAGNGGRFDGRIVNTARISGGTGIRIFNVGGALFSGGISNSGAVTATVAGGVVVSNVATSAGATFAGNIVNSGAISAGFLGFGIQGVAFAGGSFDGSIINTATISAVHTGIRIGHVGGALFSGPSPATSSTAGRSVRRNLASRSKTSPATTAGSTVALSIRLRFPARRA